MRRATPVIVTVVLTLVAGWGLPGPAQARRAGSPGSNGTGDAYFPLQGNGGYDVRHYDITFSYSPVTDQMVGSTTIAADAKQDLSQFNLDFTGLTVRSITVNGATAGFSQQAQEVVVTPPGGLTNGQAFTVGVNYDGNPTHVVDPDGTPDGWILTPDGAFVANAPQGAMTWFPGNHNLQDKATHTFRVTVPNGTTAVANGDLVSTTSAAGQTTFIWDSPEPMANYLTTATIGVFNLTRSRSTGKPWKTYVAVDPAQAAGSATVGQRTIDIVTYFDWLFGTYPFSVTGAIVDNAPSIGYSMETQTKPLYDRAPDADLMSHELSHMWFGDSVTPLTWRDIWLNEGFATYAEWLWSEQSGQGTAQSQFQSAYAIPSGSQFWQVPPGNPGGAQNIFHDAVYARGAMTLHALRQTVGSRIFFIILRTWAANHRHGSGTTAQFIDLAEQRSGRQLDDLFQRWLYQSGKPSFP